MSAWQKRVDALKREAFARTQVDVVDEAGKKFEEQAAGLTRQQVIDLAKSEAFKNFRPLPNAVHCMAMEHYVVMSRTIFADGRCFWHLSFSHSQGSGFAVNPAVAKSVARHLGVVAEMESSSDGTRIHYHWQDHSYIATSSTKSRVVS